MKTRISARLMTLALLAATPTLAAAEVFEGKIVADADIDREHASVVITGKAAYGIFWVTAYRMRLEELDPNSRRARGRNLTCYAYGPYALDVKDWTYECNLNVESLGEIRAPSTHPR